MNRSPNRNNPLHTFEMYAEIILKDIHNAQQFAKEQNLLDTQEYLNFQDELNKLSLDSDRENYVGE